MARWFAVTSLVAVAVLGSAGLAEAKGLYAVKASIRGAGLSHPLVLRDPDGPWGPQSLTIAWVCSRRKLFTEGRQVGRR
jgi:hypothetical protein